MSSHSDEINVEEILLGACLLDPKGALPIVQGIVHPSDLLGRPAIVYQAILDVQAAGVAVDPVTVKARLEHKGQLQSVTTTYLSGLLDGVPRITNVQEWATLVRNKATMRDLKAIAAELAQTVPSGSTLDVEQTIGAALARISGLGSRMAGEKSFEDPKQAMKDAMRYIDDLLAAKDGITGIPTGLSQFDALTGGLKPGQLIVFAGRASMGKTSAATTIATNAAMSGRSVGFFSLEMTRAQLLIRCIETVCGVPTAVLRHRPEAFGAIAKAAGELAEKQLWIDETPQLTSQQIMGRAQRLKAKHGLDLLIVDYLQIAQGVRTKNSNREQEVGGLASDLKMIAKELKVPVVVLSQIGREAEQGKDHRPKLWMLRESGRIENDADLVVLLYRPGYYDKGVDQSAAEWIVAKQRDGPTFTTEVRFEGDVKAFYNKDWVPPKLPQSTERQVARSLLDA